MSPRALFFFVHCLSEDQLLAFRAWLKKHGRLGRKRPKYLQLFNRMAKMAHFDEAEIRTAPFDNASTYYKARELLLEKLIGCFSTEENPALTYWNYIKTSVRFGAIEIAQHYFQKEYGLVQAQGSESELLTLCRYREQVLRDYKADLGEGLGMVPAKAVLQKISWEEQAIELIQATRSVLRKEEPVKAELRRKIAGFLEEKVEGMVGLAYYEGKLGIALDLLQLDFHTAAVSQTQMVDSILLGDIRITTIQKIKEVANALTMALFVKSREMAIHYLFELSQIQPENEIEDRVKNERWIRRSIEAAFTFGQPELAQRSIAAMQSQLALFPESTVAVYHYVICLAYFFEERFKDGHSVLRGALALPRAIRRNLAWQFDVLDLLYHFEKGNLDYLLSALDSKRKVYRKQTYPSFILKGLDLVLRNHGEVDLSILQKVRKLEGSLPESQTTYEGKNYFDFTAYIEAKANRKPLSEGMNMSLGEKIFAVAI